MNNTTTPRNPNHLVSIDGKVIHAASDLATRGARAYHVTACNGRAISDVSAWNGNRAEVTCKGCVSALASGRAVWLTTSTAAVDSTDGFICARVVIGLDGIARTVRA